QARHRGRVLLRRRGAVPHRPGRTGGPDRHAGAAPGVRRAEGRGPPDAGARAGDDPDGRGGRHRSDGRLTPPCTSRQAAYFSEAININSPVPVGVFGASGYVGQELLRLLAGHPGALLVFATAESAAGERVEGLRLVRADDAPLDRAEVVLSALPHGISGRYVQEARAVGKRAGDLSADFRLSPDAVRGGERGRGRPGLHAARPAGEARDSRDHPRAALSRARPGHGGRDLRDGLRGRAMRAGAARRAAVVEGRRIPESRGARRRRCRERAPSPTHGDRRDRQSREGRGRAGDPEHERDAGPAGDAGAPMLKVRVVKIGGNALERPEWLAACADALRPLEPVVVGHGGGRAGSTVSRRLDLPVEKQDGLRVTTPAVAEAVEMVLAGPANRLVVAALRTAGLDAIGLAGVDGGLLTARPAPGGLGHVGEIAAVRAALLESLLLAGLTPVIAPMAPGPEGGLPLNVNADEAAAAVAAAVHAAELLFVSDVPGVRVDGAVQPALDAGGVETVIELDAATAGMTVQLRAAL